MAFSTISGNVLTKFQRKMLKTHRKRTQNVRFTRLNFRFNKRAQIDFRSFFRCNEISTRTA